MYQWEHLSLSRLNFFCNFNNDDDNDDDDDDDDGDDDEKTMIELCSGD